MTLAARTETYPTPVERCSRCHATEDLIAGDGPTVCRPCVSLLAEVADDPLAASPRLRDTLAELHADVIELVDVNDARIVAWRWTAPWPVKA
jgi:hypothetical protein